eukprot:GHVR01132420.1.p2 GENE.GHVR01132420.1~~GHVR01132420.1.p2  ORF type:complete len:105 (-),score=0.95 GHVR01132420.1:1435-1749(-)
MNFIDINYVCISYHININIFSNISIFSMNATILMKRSLFKLIVIKLSDCMSLSLRQSYRYYKVAVRIMMVVLNDCCYDVVRIRFIDHYFIIFCSLLAKCQIKVY